MIYLIFLTTFNLNKKIELRFTFNNVQCCCCRCQKTKVKRQLNFDIWESHISGYNEMSAGYLQLN